MTYLCVRCNTNKDSSCFSPYMLGDRLKTRQPYCKPCRRVVHARWAAKNKERIKEYHRKRHIKIMSNPEKRSKRNAMMARWGKSLRESAVSAIGNSCACCGEYHTHFLDIDHINNDGHERRRSAERDIYEFYRSVRDRRITDVQTLCSNCNQGKRRNRGICPHVEERMAHALLVA